MIKDDCLNIRDDDRSFGSQISPELKTPNQGEISEEVLTRIKDTDGFIELQERRSPETGHEIRYRTDETSISQSDWRLPDRNTLEIVIDTDDGQANGSTEATPKDKISKPFIWRSRGDVYHRAKEAQNHAQMRLINWINRHLRGGQRSHRQHVSPVLRVKSIRFVLALMLTIFLFVPFLLHST